MENDDADTMSSTRVRRRAKPAVVQLTPPLPTPPVTKQKTSATSTPTATTAREDLSDSFLDLGRMSFETMQTGTTDDTGADRESHLLDLDVSSEYLNWGR